MMINNRGSRNSQKTAEVSVPSIGFNTISISTMIGNSAARINKAIKYIARRGGLKRTFRCCFAMRVRNQLVERYIRFILKYFTTS